jgi:hypothetical protein
VSPPLDLRTACALCASLGVAATGCVREPLITTDALPIKHVVVYRNGVAYFERGGHVDTGEVRFKMKQAEVGDFLATLAVMEHGGSSVRAAAFPLKIDDENEEAKAYKDMTPDEKKGLQTVVLSLDGKQHDLDVGYVAASPVWRPSYRLVVGNAGEAELQAWGIVENLSGEDWKDVRLSLVAGAPVAFESQLGTPVIPTRPIVTDNGEVIAAVPRAETSLRQEAPPPPPPPPAAAAAPAADADQDKGGFEEHDEEESKKVRGPGGGGGGAGRPAHMRPKAIAKSRGIATRAPAPSAPSSFGGDVRAEMEPSTVPSAPRDLRSLAAVAVEGGATRYVLPNAVTVPDKSATMVMLVSRQVPGEAMFLFAPDGSVADSYSHPFRVARFTNKSEGALERGPIAVFEQGAFLGQGMVDPLPEGATTTVPFALERGVAVDQDRKFDELGERIAKIENGELTIERDAVTQTKYRVRNGGVDPAKLLVKHPRINGARLFSPPKDTEDNVGTGSALIPVTIAAHATAELVVDERATVRRQTDWFSLVADHAMQAYLVDPRSDKATVQKLKAAWVVRNDIVQWSESRSKLQQETNTLSEGTEETRRNLRAIEKNKLADALRAKLTARLAAAATRLDDLTKRIAELDSKLAEARVQFKEGIRDILVVAPPPPGP